MCGYVGHVFVLRRILEKFRAKVKDIGLVFIDLKKANYSVLREKLWEANHTVNMGNK